MRPVSLGDPAGPPGNRCSGSADTHHIRKVITWWSSVERQQLLTQGEGGAEQQESKTWVKIVCIKFTTLYWIFFLWILPLRLTLSGMLAGREGEGEDMEQEGREAEWQLTKYQWTGNLYNIEEPEHVLSPSSHVPYTHTAPGHTVSCNTIFLLTLRDKTNTYRWKTSIDQKNTRHDPSSNVQEDIVSLKLPNYENNQLCWLVIGKINN